MRFLTTILLLALTAPAFAADGDGDGRKGNALYQAERYAEAAEAYRVGLEGRDATLAHPTTSNLFHNLGNAYYRLGQYDEAAVAYQQAVATAPDAAHFQRASYNAGNTAVAQENLEAALDHYRRALLSNPEHAEARHNYELVKRQLQDQENQQQEQEGDQDGDSEEEGEGDQNQEGENGQDGENDSENQNADGEQEGGENGEQDGEQEPSEGEEPQQPEPGEDEEQEGQQGDQPDPQDGQQPESQPQPGEAPQDPQQLSQEQAERILQALGAEETELLRQVQRRPVQPRRVEKDW